MGVFGDHTGALSVLVCLVCEGYKNYALSQHGLPLALPPSPRLVSAQADEKGTSLVHRQLISLSPPRRRRRRRRPCRRPFTSSLLTPPSTQSFSRSSSRRSTAIRS